MSVFISGLNTASVEVATSRRYC